MIWIKVVGAIAAAALLWWAAEKWYSDVQENAIAQERIAQLEGQLKLERDARHKANIARQGWHDEVTNLKAAIARRPYRTVRVCEVPAAETGAPGARDPGGDRGAAAEAPAGGPPPAGIGRDIGPELYELADSADLNVAACRALYELVKGQPAAAPTQ